MKASEFLSLLQNYLDAKLNSSEVDPKSEVKKTYDDLCRALSLLGNRKIPSNMIVEAFQKLTEDSKPSEALLKSADLEEALKRQFANLSQLHFDGVAKDKKHHRVFMGVLLIAFWVVAVPLAILTVIYRDVECLNILSGVVDLMFGLIFFTYEFISDKKDAKNDEISGIIYANAMGRPAVHIDQRVDIKGRKNNSVINYGDGNVVHITTVDDKPAKRLFIIAVVAIVIFAMLLMFVGTGAISLNNEGEIVINIFGRVTDDSTNIGVINNGAGGHIDIGAHNP